MSVNDTLRTKYKGINGNIRCTDSITESAMPNSEFEAHIHTNEVEMYHFLEGDLFFVFEGKKIAVENGMVIIICNNSYHRPIIKKTCKYIRRHVLLNRRVFSGFESRGIELYKRICKKRLIVLSPQIAQSLNTLGTFEEIGRALSTETAYGEFSAIVSALHFLIHAEAVGEGGEEYAFHPYDRKVSDIMQYIGEHLSERLTYETVSEQFYLSPKYLYKYFKKEAGVTLSRYILELRIIKAQSVLNAGGTSGEAAASAGFDDYSVFYRCFLREVGITPAQYIKQLKEKEM